MTTVQDLPQEAVEEFVIAAHGNAARVKELLQEQPPLLNVPWAKFDETALQAASHMGRRDIAEYLLAQGAPLNICTAAMLGQTERVAAFLHNDPGLAHATGAHGITVLYHAALGGDTAIADLLLSHGGGEGAGAALHAAVRGGHRDMVQWLLDHGATNVDAPDFDGHTPLHVAVQLGHDEIAVLLRRHGGTEQAQPAQ